MKVYIGPYKSYIGPYQIAEKILFWKDKDSDTVYNFGAWLADITWLNNVCEWIQSKRDVTIKVRIDKYDTWSMDHTLAHIIVPMLKQLKETAHGAPFVDDEDVPVELQKASAPPTKNEWDTDDNHFKRWDWVMGEMIFAFESKLTDWEMQFWKVKPELDFTEYPEDEGQMVTPVRWKVDGDCDWEARNAYQSRITNGFRLFGKYYEGLWD
jgi:hypothetical protein